jgi:hypothetical protein
MSVIALLVAGAVASMRLGQRSRRLMATDALLTTAADYALGTALADWRRLRLADLPLGQPTALDIPTSQGGIHARVVITRLPLGLLWLVADVSAGDDRGHRRTNLVVRFRPVGPVPSAPIVAQGDVQLGSGVVFAADTSQDPECAVWSGPRVVVAPGSEVGGLDSATVVTSAGAADSASFFLTPRQLAALGETGSVVHVMGDTAIDGGSFDGLLIVEGSLTITGTFVANGLIVARGPVEVASGSFSLTGAVMSYAAKVSGKPAIKFLGVTIRYSPCTVHRMLRRAVVPRSVSQRSWAELF